MFELLAKLLGADDSSLTSDGKYRAVSPKNLHGHIESVGVDEVSYRNSDGLTSAPITADDGSSIVVNDPKDGWLRLWKS